MQLQATERQETVAMPHLPHHTRLSATRPIHFSHFLHRRRQETRSTITKLSSCYYVDTAYLTFIVLFSWARSTSNGAVGSPVTSLTAEVLATPGFPKPRVCHYFYGQGNAFDCVCTFFHHHGHHCEKIPQRFS